MSYPPKHVKNCSWPISCLQCGTEESLDYTHNEKQEFYRYKDGHICGDCATYLADLETRSGVEHNHQSVHATA